MKKFYNSALFCRKVKNFRRRQIGEIDQERSGANAGLFFFGIRLCLQSYFQEITSVGNGLEAKNLGSLRFKAKNVENLFLPVNSCCSGK